MLDVLAAISSVDPPSLLAWLILAFAAAGYPLGIMLGASCSPCCGCAACAEGSLPETLTVTFSGLADQTPGPDLIALSFTSCYGSGASAQVTAPGGDPATDKGPIGAVSLTNGGSGYAVLGRVAPTLTVSGGSGTGATFTATLSQSPDACGLARWAISSIAASGGTDYADGDALTITIAEGDTEVQAASALLYLGREEPEITLDGSATTTVVITQNYNPGTSPITWGVESVTVTSGGSGYTEGDAATFLTAADDVEETAATGTIRVVHAEPTNAIVSFYDAATAQPSAGTGATLEPVWQETALDQYDAPNLKKYRLTGMTVTSGGSGYTAGDVIEITFASVDDGGTAAYASITVSGVNGSGAITQVSVLGGGGEYIGSRTDALHSVAMTPSTRGSYYKDLPASRYVVVQNGGLYYREDASEPPYVAAVTVGITQTAPSTGTGASLSVTIDDDTGSETFGQITGVNIDDGGSGYLAWQWKNTKCCGDYYNGMSVVVKRNNSQIGSYIQDEPCRYMHRMCGVGNTMNNLGYVIVDYAGPSTPPKIYLVSEDTRSRSGATSSDSFPSTTCNTEFTTEQLVQDCGTWQDTNGGSLSFTSSGGATATLSVGGNYDAGFRDSGGQSCHICCQGDSEVPEEIEVTINDPRSSKPVDFAGTYVAQYGGNANLVGNIQPHISGWRVFYTPPNPPPFTAPNLRIHLYVEPCSQPGAFFSPDGWGCDDCHKKCRVMAFASLDTSGLASDQCGYATEIDGDSACGLCQSTPICSVAGLSLSLPPVTANGCGGTLTLNT